MKSRKNITSIVSQLFGKLIHDNRLQLRQSEDTFATIHPSSHIVEKNFKSSAVYNKRFGQTFGHRSSALNILCPVRNWKYQVMFFKI